MGCKKIVLFFIIIFQVIEVRAQGWSLSNPSESIVRIKNSFGRCTGTRISSAGHILTARHCFNACLIQAGDLTKESLLPEYGFRSPTLYKINSFRETFCEAEVDGRLTKIEVVAGSLQFMIPSEKNTLFEFAPEKYSELLEQGTFHNGDFLVIKEQYSRTTTCELIRVGQAREQGLVFYEGYPLASQGRGQGRDSDGMSLLRSQGEQVTSILHNSCLAASISTKELIQKYDRDELILSTVDLLSGGSGSLLKNEKGETLGLLNSLYHQGINPTLKYCSGSAVALSFSEIMRNIRLQLSVSQIMQVFDCQNKK